MAPVKSSYWSDGPPFIFTRLDCFKTACSSYWPSRVVSNLCHILRIRHSVLCHFALIFKFIRYIWHFWRFRHLRKRTKKTWGLGKEWIKHWDSKRKGITKVYPASGAFLWRMRCMLLGYSFEPRPKKSRALGTAGSVINGCSQSRGLVCGDFNSLLCRLF